MSPPDAPPNLLKRVRLDWTGRGDVFKGGGTGTEVVIDSDGREGPSPTDALLLSLAGCMGVDVRMILEKSRVTLDALSVAVSGRRAEKPPRRFLAIDLHYRLSGPGPEDLPKVERAVQLSRDTYCSVLHSLAPDIEITIDIALVDRAQEAP